MYIETKEIGPEGLVVDRFIELSEPLPLERDEVIEVGRAHVSGELVREATGIQFTGDIETGARMRCGRCLEQYDLPLELHFGLLYTTSREAVERGEGRIDEESMTLVQFDGTRIDLRALLREQVYLGLPLKPLCRADCRGLCPRCGANLNAGACGCPRERAEDPRLGILKKLL
jgi:uncharacterized protein